jgi:hypothetical protein
VIRITEESLSAGRAFARAYLQQHPPSDQVSKSALERFITVYEAVKRTTNNHDAALFIGSQEARSLLAVKPVTRTFTYPQLPGAILDHVERNPAILAGYFSFLTSTSQSALSTAATPAAVALGEHMYVLYTPVTSEPLVGLAQEQTALEKYARMLFLYDPQAMANSDSGRFPKTVLLTGPPGTGKSSLLKHFIATARNLQRITGTPFTTEVYDASNFSSYFGKSTRILKQKLSRVQNPRGVGMFCIEDVDMVLQSRNDTNTFHGVLELQQYLMNHLSGLQPYYGNTITFVTTNKPESIDSALLNRLQMRFSVNPFTQLETHTAYFQLQFPNLTSNSCLAAASQTHRAQHTGRDLESIAFLVRETTTRAPTDAELAQRSIAHRYAPITDEVFSAVIAAYTAARHTQAS